ncbi:hypothetical protein [Vibrio europaeus]|uniref:Uncharacterized protein n=1 Tax=Vibrio europaeus TaxID=300876 RepID=A0A178J4T6_9VIBR|nr:hypothetical protein [Vibrio europaeus]MDC5706157.1 hypothetical protein [Vibrio europaeus]MDC5709567.1 hypothetical protein [Vibrio europaeus]MDC5713966.1 hypothetical protein [Vibrio europaeus]MDC5723425.1 hypothetical protein [Vibrio europaeus]MDC5730562.1 hypothetical protein [Vibrio europaeus]
MTLFEPFPLPEESLPFRLRELLKPIGSSPDLRVEVACMQESNLYEANAECLHLQMAVVAEQNYTPIDVLREASDGVVAFSVPSGDNKGCSEGFLPTLSGYDYLVASWGNGSFYTYNLSEKVWMTLGLTPRCIGNDKQRLVYDALDVPEFDIAEGEISTEHQWSLKRNVCWTMSNEYLRRYLWLRGAIGVRVFFYQVQLEDTPLLRDTLNGSTHIVLKPKEGTQWYELDLREHNGGILLQLWASVEAVKPELCPEQDAESLAWSERDIPMTYSRANAIRDNRCVYLDDRFLEKYEQSKFYDTTPVKMYNRWHSNPSYKGQWSFTNCHRIGRNLIRVEMRELYKPKPSREIVHAHSYVVDKDTVDQLDLSEEHIVIKVDRLVKALVRVGDGLSVLGESVGQLYSTDELIGFDKLELRANGWLNYPSLSRLAQVAPLNMTQQQFLSRCKNVHEVLQKVPNGFLKSLLRHAGCSSAEIKNFGSLKLLQSLLNIVELLNKERETVECFQSENAPMGWNEQNEVLSPLFLNNELRIADAHDAIKKCIDALQALGFDTASLSVGYGRALDFVLDEISRSITYVAEQLESLVNQQ